MSDKSDSETESSEENNVMPKKINRKVLTK